MQQSDVAEAIRAVCERPQQVVSLALEAADADDFVKLLVEHLDLTTEQATVVVDIPFRRLNADARARFQ